MASRIEIKGDTRKGAEGLERRLKIEFQRSGLRIINDVKLMMTTSPATGHVYRARGTKGVEHRASAPGEPPAVDTGEYRNNVLFAVGKEDGRLKLKAGVVPALAARANALEFGTLDGTLEPRPMWVHALRNELPKLRQRLGGKR